jgi:hypothetical protein
MKKITFVLVLACMASTIFAQNTAVVTQTGDNDNATVSQTGNDHKAQVAQTGDKNVATVDQFGGDHNYIDVVSKGDKNIVDVDQKGTDLNSANAGIYGYIHQTGDKNDATLNQDGTKIDAKIDQQNGKNMAVFTQKGSLLQVESNGLVQIRAFGNEGNKATLNQKDLLQSLNIIQTGSGNEITSDQSGNTNQFSAFQTGIKNTAQITQSGNDNWDGWTSTTNNVLNQSGAYNDAKITQLGNSKFLVSQFGASNETGLELTGSWANVMQIGNYNIVGGLLNCNTTTDIAVLLPGSSLDALQIGDNNKLYVNTAGNLKTIQNNLLTHMVGNTIKYTQTNVGDVELTQLGDKNLMWLKNTSSSVPMDVDVDQIGDGNTVALLGQTTSCAKFAGAHLDVDQKGNYNSLNLDSNSSGAIVDVLQKGNSNQASVIQN